MEFTYQLNKNVNRVLCLDGVTSAQNGKDIDISDALCCMLVVSGEFDGKIVPILRDKDGNIEQLYSDFTDLKGNYVAYINKPGVYYVRNIEGYSVCVPRLDKYTSGSVTVVGMTITDGLRMPQDRNVVLAKFNVSVEAGSDHGMDVVNLNGYPFHYVTICADSEHQFEVTADYSHNGSQMGSPIKGLTLFASNGSDRGCCEWQEAKCANVTPRIINSDEMAHTYELVVYGVR